MNTNIMTWRRQQGAALEKSGVRSSKRHATDSPPIEVKIPIGDKRSEYMQVMCDLIALYDFMMEGATTANFILAVLQVRCDLIIEGDTIANVRVPVL